MGGADGAAAVQPKKDETVFSTLLSMPMVGDAAGWGFWDAPVTPGVETSSNPCGVDNLSNIYLAWDRNL